MVHIYLTVRGLNKHPPLATSTSVNNCFLARAKSEAFDNIYSLLKKKKTRAMLAAKVTPENGVKQQYV